MTRETGRISVLIVDDHPLVREGLRALLDGDEFDVVGEAGSGREAVEKAEASRPDVVLMDIRMPDMDGLTATRLLKQKLASTAVVIVTSFESTDYLREAIDAGAAGFVLKGSPRDDVVRTIKVVHEGGAVFAPSLLRDILHDTSFLEREVPPEALDGFRRLNERERSTLALIAGGRTNQEIAVQLEYSLGTIKNIVQALIEKMQVSDRTQAAVVAVRAGLDIDN